MKRFLKSLLALHLAFYGMPFAGTRSAHAQPSLPPDQKITEDFLSYIHTTSPEVVIDLVDTDLNKSKGLYSFDAYIIDLSANSKTKAMNWTAQSLRQIRNVSPTAEISVINVTDPSQIQLTPSRGRRPSALPAVDTRNARILANDIARLAGVGVQDKFAKSAQAPTSGQIVPVAIVMVERVNGAPINWTFIEVHGHSVGTSVGVTTAIGSLSGKVQFNSPGFGAVRIPNRDAFLAGYNRLMFQNQRLSQEFVARPIFAPAQMQTVTNFVRTTQTKTKYVRSVTHQAALYQIPQVYSWLGSLATDSFVNGLAESGPISFLTSAAQKSWEVALETSLEAKVARSPEMQSKINKLRARNKMGMYFGETLFGQLVGNNFGTGPEAWFIYTVAAGAALGKFYYDYTRMMEAIDRETETELRVAAAAPQPRPSTRAVPMSCKDVMGSKPNARMAGL